MIGEGDTAVNAFVGIYPSADRQKLRQLSREAKKEREKSAPPRSARLLFKELRGVLEGVAEVVPLGEGE
jgi:ribosome-associated protein